MRSVKVCLNCKAIRLSFNIDHDRNEDNSRLWLMCDKEYGAKCFRAGKYAARDFPRNCLRPHEQRDAANDSADPAKLLISELADIRTILGDRTDKIILRSLRELKDGK